MSGYDFPAIYDNNSTYMVSKNVLVCSTYLQEPTTTIPNLDLSALCSTMASSSTGTYGKSSPRTGGGGDNNDNNGTYCRLVKSKKREKKRPPHPDGEGGGRTTEEEK